METPLDIRLVEAADLPAILEISNHYAHTSPANFAVEPESLESWQESFRATQEKYPWLIAAVDGEARDKTKSPHPRPLFQGERGVVGFAKASPWKGRCAYHWSAETTVYLWPERQRQGLGRALYSRLIDIMRAQGFRTLVGGITLPNPASVRLHESFGFRKIAHFERIGFKFGTWHDVGYWELHLRDDHAPPDAIRSVREVTESATILA